MKKSYGKGIATHTGPELCGAAREGGDEALTGESTGPGIQPRKKLTPGCRRCKEKRKAPLGAPISRGALGSRAVTDPCTYGSALHGNREIPRSPQTELAWGRIGVTSATIVILECNHISTAVFPIPPSHGLGVS